MSRWVRRSRLRPRPASGTCRRNAMANINPTDPEWSVSMKRTTLRTVLSAAALIGAAIMGSNALAQSPQGRYGYPIGPDMMGGYGPDYRMDPGILGNRGPDYGIDPGMTGRYGPGPDLHLTPEQRVKIGKVQDELRRKHWALMGQIRDEQALMLEHYNAEPRDDAAVSKNYRNMSELRHQMFDLSLSARRQIDDVLTKEQREQQRRG